MSWFEDTPETRRLEAEEGLILDATELICEALDERGWTRAQLAEAVGVRRSEITMRLRGSRNLTLRSIAAMLDALDYDAVLTKRDRHVRDLHHDTTVTVSADPEPQFPVDYVPATSGLPLPSIRAVA